MRFRLAAAAAVLQVLALGYMGGEREWILRTGHTVLLRTAPIDPRDPMRGDYSRLDYEISRVPLRLCEGGLAAAFAASDGRRLGPERRVYARLQIDDEGVAHLVALTDVKPDHGPFIRGFARSQDPATLHVRYGIEALFMEQGSAQRLDDQRFRDKPGVPLDIEVALGGNGTAVIRRFAWEPLGITLSFERAPVPSGPADRAAETVRPRQVVTAVKVELKNHSEADVAIVDLPGNGSLRLVPDERGPAARFRWVGEARTPPPPAAAHVRVLRPGTSHTMRIDLTHPDWFVAAAGRDPVGLRDLTDVWSTMFRIEYVPPTRAAVAALPDAALIRHGSLRSRAFNAFAGVD